MTVKRADTLHDASVTAPVLAPGPHVMASLVVHTTRSTSAKLRVMRIHKIDRRVLQLIGA